MPSEWLGAVTAGSAGTIAESSCRWQLQHDCQRDDGDAAGGAGGAIGVVVQPGGSSTVAGAAAAHCGGHMCSVIINPGSAGEGGSAPSASLTLEWLGGPAEFHFRKARAESDGLRQSLEPARYPPSLVAAAGEAGWASCSRSMRQSPPSRSVVGALTRARAALDLIGVTGDFLADEVRHVELASPVVMQLGGGRRNLPTPLSYRRAPPPRRTPLRARMSWRCALVASRKCLLAPPPPARVVRETTHPLLRSVYESILRDEARHRRFGSLYFEWQPNRLDAPEQARLGAVALDALPSPRPARRRAETLTDSRPEWQGFGAGGSGWIEPSRYMPLAPGRVRQCLTLARPRLDPAGGRVQKH